MHSSRTAAADLYDAAVRDDHDDATTQMLWWPPSKINGRYLAPWLAALDEETVADHLPRSPVGWPSPPRRPPPSSASGGRR